MLFLEITYRTIILVVFKRGTLWYRIYPHIRDDDSSKLTCVLVDVLKLQFLSSSESFFPKTDCEKRKFFMAVNNRLKLSWTKTFLDSERLLCFTGDERIQLKIIFTCRPQNQRVCRMNHCTHCNSLHPILLWISFGNGPGLINKHYYKI